MSFATPLPLIPADLTKMAAAVKRAGIHLCAWPGSNQLEVWGIARTIPQSCIVIETLQPGLLVVKQSPPNDAGKYRNIAVLQGDSIKSLALSGKLDEARAAFDAWKTNASAAARAPLSAATVELA